MGQGYFVKQDGGVLGPYSGAELKELATSGRLRPDSLISTDGAIWVAATKAKGLVFAESSTFVKEPQSATPHSGLRNQVVQMFVALSQQIKNDRVLIHPNIPRDRLDAFLSSNNISISGEQPVVLIDDSMTGNATKGLLITDHHLYARELFDSLQKRTLGKCHSISCKKALLDVQLIVSGNKLVGLSQISAEDLERLTVAMASANRLLDDQGFTKLSRPVNTWEEFDEKTEKRAKSWNNKPSAGVAGIMFAWGVLIIVGSLGSDPDPTNPTSGRMLGGGFGMLVMSVAFWWFGVKVLKWLTRWRLKRPFNRLTNSDNAADQTQAVFDIAVMVAATRFDVGNAASIIKEVHERANTHPIVKHYCAIAIERLHKVTER